MVRSGHTQGIQVKRRDGSNRSKVIANSRRRKPSAKRALGAPADEPLPLAARIQAEREQLFKAISIVECCKYANATVMEVDDQDYMLGVYDALYDILDCAAGELGCIADDYRGAACTT